EEVRVDPARVAGRCLHRRQGYERGEEAEEGTHEASPDLLAEGEALLPERPKERDGEPAGDRQDGNAGAEGGPEGEPEAETGAAPAPDRPARRREQIERQAEPHDGRHRAERAHGVVEEERRERRHEETEEEAAVAV